MIRYFRHIRERLLSENKFSKYLLYAIGEIILVMIGILLALQVSNWNQNRILAKEELQIMKSLHREFNKNIDKFDKAYEFHLNRKESIETIVSIKAKDLSLDSLKSLVRGVHRSYTFDPNQGIYKSIINSGKIELISNDALKERIAGFQDLLRDFQEEEMYVIDFTKQNIHKLQLTHALNDNYKVHKRQVVASKEEEQRIKGKYVRFIESNIFESHLIILSGWMNSIFEEGPVLRDELVSIIKLLEKEIETH